MDIARKKPTINLESGIIYEDIPDYSILVQKIEETNSISYVENVKIFDETEASVIKTVRRCTPLRFNARVVRTRRFQPLGGQKDSPTPAKVTLNWRVSG